MPLRLNLQWKVLLLVAATITLILLASTYLHGLITKSLSEETRYDNAIRQVATVAKRTQTHNYFNSPADLLQEIEFLANARPEFIQLDVYQNGADGEKLVATTAPAAPRLPYLNEQSKDNEFREMERPLHRTGQVRRGDAAPAPRFPRARARGDVIFHIRCSMLSVRCSSVRDRNIQHPTSNIEC